LKEGKPLTEKADVKRTLQNLDCCWIHISISAFNK